MANRKNNFPISSLIMIGLAVWLFVYRPVSAPFAVGMRTALLLFGMFGVVFWWLTRGIPRNSAQAADTILKQQKALMDAAKTRAQKLEAKGKTVDFKELLRMEPDGGTTNIRNTSSPHWRGWLKPENRCLVPANSFAEYAPEPNPETKKKDVVWFALNEDRPLFAFAGIWTTFNGDRGTKSKPIRK